MSSASYPATIVISARNLTLAEATAWFNALIGSEAPGYPGAVIVRHTNFEFMNERTVSDANIPAHFDVAALVELGPKPVPAPRTTV